MNKKKIKNIIKITIISGITILTAIFIIILSLINKNNENINHKCARIWAFCILKLIRVKINITTSAKIKKKIPYIYMPNHQSNFDIPVILSNIKGQFRWLAKKELFLIPIFGMAMKKCGYISINRNSRISAIYSIKNAEKTLKDGISILIFPEGTRNKKNKILALKKGGFILSINTDTPIIPIVIKGTKNIKNKNFFNNLYSKINIKILNPIETTQYNLNNKDLLISKVHKLLSKN